MKHVDAGVGEKSLCLDDLVWFAIQIVERLLILPNRTFLYGVKYGHMLTVFVPNSREGDGALAGRRLQAVKIDLAEPDEDGQAQNEAYHKGGKS